MYLIKKIMDTERNLGFIYLFYSCGMSTKCKRQILTGCLIEWEEPSDACKINIEFTIKVGLITSQVM